MKASLESKLDIQWAKEAKDRLAAYQRGEIRAIPLKEVLSKYTLKPANTPLRHR